MLELGLVSVSFRDRSPSEIIRAAARCGLSCIEWGSDVHAPCGDAGRLKSIKAECDGAGINCCSYGTYFRIGENSPEEIFRYISAAKLLGAEILRLWCGGKSALEYSAAEKKALFEECRRLARAAEKENVKLCLECHINTFTDTLSETLELLESVNSPAFGMYWQPNQYKSEDENYEYAKAVCRRAEIVHAFNWQGEKKLPLALAGQTWRRYLSLFPGKTVLLEFMPDGRIESLAEEAEALKKITEGL